MSRFPLFSRVFAGFALASALMVAPIANAETPEESVRSAEAAAPFCTAPRTPLDREALALCPYAEELPNCEAFVAACEAAKEPPKVPDLSWLAPLAIVVKYLIFAGLVVLGFGAIFLVIQAIRRVIRERSADATKDAAVKVTALVENPTAPIAFEATAADALLAQADALLARGEAGLALAHYLAASLRALDDKGFLRVARSRTNGEYLRAIGDREFRGAVAPLVRAVDRAEFGGIPVTVDDVRLFGATARAIVASPRRNSSENRSPFAAAAAVTMLALFALGCGDGKKSGSPQGTEYFQALTSKQGLTVSPLHHELSRLPDPTGDSAIAVMLDVEETPLDEETDHELTGWVARGGRLFLSGPQSAWPKELATAITHGTTDEDDAKKRAEEGFADAIAKRLHLPKGSPRTLLLNPREAQNAALIAEGSSPIDDEDEEAAEDDEDEEALSSTMPATKDDPTIIQGFGLHGSSRDRRGTPLVRYQDRSVAGTLLLLGKGRVVTFDNSDIFTNIGLAHPRNPTLALTLLRITAGRGTPYLTTGDSLLTYGKYLPIERARRHDGRQGASNPLSALLAAGLRLPLLHGLIFAAILFLAYGRRMGRAEPDRLDPRRAFAEHVEANGLLWAKRKFGPLALATWSRFADERVRARMPKNATDPAEFLATSTGQDLEMVKKLWERATTQVATAPARGDEMAVLKTLAILVDRVLGADASPRDKRSSPAPHAPSTAS